LHLAHGLPITEDVFNQQHTTQFRLGLYAELTTIPAPSLHPQYMSSFFPQLCSDSKLSTSPARFLMSNRSCSSEARLVTKEVLVDTLKEPDNGSESHHLKNTTTEDLYFRDIFLKTPSTFSDFKQIDHLVEQYEKIPVFIL
jgi:hypothetical protein